VITYLAYYTYNEVFTILNRISIINFWRSISNLDHFLALFELFRLLSLLIGKLFIPLSILIIVACKSCCLIISIAIIVDASPASGFGLLSLTAIELDQLIEV
jgi:hypothetical protein